MGYIKISNSLRKKVDEFMNLKQLDLADLLQDLSFNTTAKITAGASNTTVAGTLLIAPTKLKITKVFAAIDVVQTGTNNTPVVQVYNLTKAQIIAASSAVQLGGNVGDKIAMILNENYSEIAEGDVLQVRIVNPTATITVPLTTTAQIEWNSVY